jgi:hypothetical protein
MPLQQADDENQTRCWVSTEGHIWMCGYYDTLPPGVRRRLQQSRFNLCPACLTTYFLPRARRRHRQAGFFAAIEIMEDEVSKKEKNR